MQFLYPNTDVASYADDSTSYMDGNNLDDLITSFEQASNILFEWIKNNIWKTNDNVSINVTGYKKDISDTIDKINKTIGCKIS